MTLSIKSNTKSVVVVSNNKTFKGTIVAALLLNHKHIF